MKGQSKPKKDYKAIKMIKMQTIRFKKQDLVQMKDSKNKNLKEDQVLKLKE